MAVKQFFKKMMMIKWKKLSTKWEDVVKCGEKIYTFTAENKLV